MVMISIILDLFLCSLFNYIVWLWFSFSSFSLEIKDNRKQQMLHCFSSKKGKLQCTQKWDYDLGFCKNTLSSGDLAYYVWYLTFAIYTCYFFYMVITKIWWLGFYGFGNLNCLDFEMLVLISSVSKFFCSYCGFVLVFPLIDLWS